MNINVATNISNEFKNIEIIIKAPEMSEQVQSLVMQVTNILNKKEQVIGIKDSKIYLLSTNKIIYFYSQEKNNYCKTENGLFKVKEKLYELENVLSKDFIRISNSCIINLNFVESFDPSLTGTVKVIFKDGTKEYVSRRKISEVMKRIKEWGE